MKYSVRTLNQCFVRNVVSFFRTIRRFFKCHFTDIMYFGVHFSTSCSCFVLLFVLLVHIVKVQAAPSAVLSDLHSFSSTWEDDKGEAPWPNQVQLEQKDDPQPLRRNIWLETLAATATESVSYPTQALPITQSDSQYPPAPDSPYQMESAEQLLFEFVNIGPANLFWGELARSLPVYNISDQCRASLNQTLAALHLGQQWAFSCKYILFDLRFSFAITRAVLSTLSFSLSTFVGPPQNALFSDFVD